jgi:alpha-amylase/alpha-mannosidase (GH57 family)
MAATKRFVCIHGHFYQPPRENPWLETVETQDSAAPYHDWNERICAECYAPNGAARIVNIKNQITRIVNNYARMSFNFGPTLLSWLRENAPRTHRMILDGERRSRKTFRGHSSAMAQVYNHMILPLASRRDRITQIRWGIADYESNYGVSLKACGSPKPPSITNRSSSWRSTASNSRCSLLTSASAFVPSGTTASKDEAAWTDTPDASVDTTRPYLVRFASGLSIAVFFYNGPASRAIAFEGLLNSGDNFVARLKSGFKDSSAPQLVHVATDGESYGHHHKHGEMALAYALRILEEDKTVKLINYASFLAQFAPEYECEIVEDTSWSCCTASSAGAPTAAATAASPASIRSGAPPPPGSRRTARCLVPLTEQEGAKLFRDVWAARDAYISVVLDRSEESIARFFQQACNSACSSTKSASRPRAHGDAAPRPAHVHQLRLVLRRHLRHRDRADHRLCRARAATGAAALPKQAASLEPAFLARLAEAHSNDPSAPATAHRSTRNASKP